MKRLNDKLLCKLVMGDALKEALGLFKKLGENPTHICIKCRRASNDKTRLCEPEELGE